MEAHIKELQAELENWADKHELLRWIAEGQVSKLEAENAKLQAEVERLAWVVAEFGQSRYATTHALRQQADAALEVK
jgi:hypothetical protein